MPEKLILFVNIPSKQDNPGFTNMTKENMSLSKQCPQQKDNDKVDRTVHPWTRKQSRAAHENCL